MSNELVGVLIALTSISVALCGLILTSMYRMETRLRQDMSQVEGRLREDVSQLRAELKGEMKQLGDRVARLEHGQAKLEGLLEGLREAITGRTVAG